MKDVIPSENLPSAQFQVDAENLELETRSDRLRECVRRAGGNAAVADKAKVGSTTLSTYLNGKEWKLGIIEKIADACGVSLQWLLFGTEQSASAPPAHTPLSDDIAHLDYYDVRASAGFGAMNSEAAPEKVAVSRAFLRNDLGLSPDSALMLQVDGDSMEPTLSAGNRIIVDTRRHPALNGIHVLIFGGALLVKRLIMNLDGTVTVQSDNPVYAPQTAAISRFQWGKPDGNDTITVIGRVAYRLQSMS
ncbi:MAG: S24 family peptidase [Acetobacter sp.]|uniref:LexA family transcriptional regulator n=1 Tax=Acetobacter sp. TaxID=440 RepID=UPI0039E86E31